MTDNSQHGCMSTIPPWPCGHCPECTGVSDIDCVDQILQDAYKLYDQMPKLKGCGIVANRYIYLLATLIAEAVRDHDTVIKSYNKAVEAAEAAEQRAEKAETELKELNQTLDDCHRWGRYE